MKNEGRRELIELTWQDIREAKRLLENDQPYKAYVCLDRAEGNASELLMEFNKVIEAQRDETAGDENGRKD